jgi:hypothetical protein
VRLVRVGKQLDGVQVVYRGCARDAARKQQLREGLRRELNVKSPDVDVPYQVWDDQSLVHLATDPRDDTCTLTVAGPRFGKVFGERCCTAACRTSAVRQARDSDGLTS